MSDLTFLACRLQVMASDGHGYYAQEDIKRLDRAADAMFAAQAEIDRLTRELAEARDKALEEAATLLSKRADAAYDGLIGLVIREDVVILRALKEKP